MAPGPLVRVMAYSLLYLVDLAGAAAAWCVTVNRGEIDRDRPVVHWIGIGGGEHEDDSINDGGSGLRWALDSDDPVVLLDEVPSGEVAWQLPMSEQMNHRGFIDRMVLVCRHQGEATGVLGFLLKKGAPGFSQETANLVRIYGAVAGHTFSVVRETEHHLGARPRSSLATLSARETEVATLAARGAPNAEIAAALGISTGTVKAHLHRVFDKLGVDTRTKLALLISSDRARRPDEGRPDRSSP
ncbi:MAG: LuxR C-terminal-related transcriptional regulator [Actinomycetota bacterium]|nr:LuxR C-terminal-related transcriptional regulator [Actinomycetota bacterium]